ncbi:MAG: NYN domain-containing protein [Armatimonadota bacterium]
MNPLQNESPEPLPLLIAALPPRVLLEIIKADKNLCKTVLQGFTPRPATMAHGVVRGRLEQEMIRYPELATFFFNTWKEIYANLLSELNDPEFTPDALSLSPLLQTCGESVLQYALLHADREDVRAWAGCMGEIDPPEPESVAPQPSPVPESGAPPAAGTDRRQAEIQQKLQALQAAHEGLQQELHELKQQYQLLSARESDLRRQYEATEARLEREGRRARRAEENVAALRKQLKQAEMPPDATEAAPPSELIAAVEEALAALQRGLGRLPAPEQEPLPPRPITPSPQPAKRAPQPPAADPAVTLPMGRTKHTYRASQIRQAIALNDEDFLQRLRDGLAKLAKTPEKEREAVQTLVKAGIPAPLLTGPLHPAVVDGSNIANMSRSARGKLAYITQIRRACWEEGYFPVIVIVDASLRHQIDQPDELMTMVERGEIRMAPPGTSADPLLIEETKERGATLVTNDRMIDWPDAKKLEKRHVEMDRDRVHLGNFHNSAQWF